MHAPSEPLSIHSCISSRSLSDRVCIVSDVTQFKLRRNTAQSIGYSSECFHDVHTSHHATRFHNLCAWGSMPTKSLRIQTMDFSGDVHGCLIFREFYTRFCVDNV